MTPPVVPPLLVRILVETLVNDLHLAERGTMWQSGLRQNLSNATGAWMPLGWTDATESPHPTSEGADIASTAMVGGLRSLGRATSLSWVDCGSESFGTPSSHHKIRMRKQRPHAQAAGLLTPDSVRACGARHEINVGRTASTNSWNSIDQFQSTQPASRANQRHRPSTRQPVSADATQAQQRA